MRMRLKNRIQMPWPESWSCHVFHIPLTVGSVQKSPLLFDPGNSAGHWRAAYFDTGFNIYDWLNLHHICADRKPYKLSNIAIKVHTCQLITIDSHSNVFPSSHHEGFKWKLHGILHCARAFPSLALRLLLYRPLSFNIFLICALSFSF
jgi:hypothetical protein